MVEPTSPPRLTKLQHRVLALMANWDGPIDESKIMFILDVGAPQLKKALKALDTFGYAERVPEPEVEGVE